MANFAKFVGSVVLGIVVYMLMIRYVGGTPMAGGIGGVATFLLCMK